MGPPWLLAIDRQTVLGLIVLAAIVPVLIGVMRAGLDGVGAEFVIRHRPGSGTTVRGRVPRSKHAQIAAFFDRELAPGRQVSVAGHRVRGRALRLEISGGLNPFQRQRIRNYLVDLLA